MSDRFYSFGIAHPGAITLHNYPRFLQKLTPDGHDLDLAATTSSGSASAACRGTTSSAAAST